MRLEFAVSSLPRMRNFWSATGFPALSRETYSAAWPEGSFHSSIRGPLSCSGGRRTRRKRDRNRIRSYDREGKCFVRPVRSSRRPTRPLELEDLVHDLLDTEGGLISDQGLDLGEIGHAAHHVLEPGLVGLLIGDEVDLQGRVDAVADKAGQGADGDLAVVADVEDLAVGPRLAGQPYQGAHDVAHPAEASGLGAVAEHGDGPSVQGLLDEARDHHAVAAGLARADGSEEADDDRRHLALLEVGEREEFVDQLGRGVGPAALRAGADHAIILFGEGDFGRLPVDLAGRGDDRELLLLGGVEEDDLGAADVGFDGADG